MSLRYSQAKELVKGLGRSKVESLIDQHEVEMLVSGLELSISVDQLEESYQGFWSSDEEFVEDLISDIYDLDLPYFVYIDWERTAFDVMMDYMESDGHYFRNI